ncbi:MAG: ParB/RepB/Spo0J family partition protein [Actinobacteria bacterium]|nr:ParB/RepB/Spo0J family partition protein [Actinomycetota bacterium]
MQAMEFQVTDGESRSLVHGRPRRVAHVAADAVRHSPVVRIPLSRLKPGDSARTDRVRAPYLQVLIQLDGAWPPILVDRSDHTIVDGHYRYLAAKFLRHADIACVYFDGDKDEAFAEAVRRNTEHGLPLTLPEREAAACRILERCSHWSDRRVGELCALAPSTVARLRGAHLPPPAEPQLERRVGRDNRVRPADRLAARRRVIEAIEANPAASLRAIARLAGSSPETVRTVRARMTAAAETPLTVVRPSDDAALVAVEGGAEFSAWLERTAVAPDDWRTNVESVPLSRVYEIADEARRRAACWLELAEALENRARRTKA